MDTNTVLSPKELSDTWADLARNDQLPDWYELTEHGELVMSPRPETRHQRLCAELIFQLRSQLGGEAVGEAAVLTTTAGIRVPDVVWMPQERWQTVSPTNLLRDPELVVEVLSPGNRPTEIAHKVQAYLASGIREVLVVDLQGKLTFHRNDGPHTSSAFDIQLSLPKHLFDVQS